MDAQRFRRLDVQGPGLSQRYEVISGTFVAGHYLRPGDLLRVESVSTETLRSAAALLQTQGDLKYAAPCFFTLDSSSASQYSAQMLETIWKKEPKDFR